MITVILSVFGTIYTLIALWVMLFLSKDMGGVFKRIMISVLWLPAWIIFILVGGVRL